MKKLYTIILLAACLLFISQQIQAQHFVTVNSPGGIAGEVSPVGSPNADFGGNLSIGQEVTGDLAQAFTTDPDSLMSQMGCDSMINPLDLAGKIAMVRRGPVGGNCWFSDKIWYAQEAGAIAVIICNYDPDVINMGAGGDYAGLDTIPSAMLDYDDCEVIRTEMAAGNTVNITISGPKAFTDAAMSYSYHTPQSQIWPMQDIRVRLVNAKEDTLYNITLACEITDPDGNMTVLDATIEEFLGNTDSLVFFPEYTPTVLGEYTGVFTNSLTPVVLTEKFVITEDLFATDRGTITTANNRQDLFETNSLYQYHYGNLYNTTSNPVTATHASFGVGNVADIFTGNPDLDVVTVVLYDADLDDNDELDFGASPLFDDLTAIGLGQHFLTGNEGAEEVLVVELFSTTGAQVIELDTIGEYYVVLKYDGDPVTATTCPSFIGSDNVDYYAFTTCMYLGGTFYNGGWSDASVLARLHVDQTINGTDNITALDVDKAKLFPNPAAEFINLELNLEDMAEEVRVDMINYDGKVVGTFELHNVKSDVYDFETENLPNGIYFLSIKTPEGYRSIPFTVAH